MLPKRSRLRAAEVKEVLAKGRSFSAGPYRGRFLEGRAPLGVAAIVSKKLVRTAVARNSLRRKAYRDLKGLTLPSSGLLAVFVRPPRS
jgi:ribonuclease P protein component